MNLHDMLNHRHFSSNIATWWELVPIQMLWSSPLWLSSLKYIPFLWFTSINTHFDCYYSAEYPEVSPKATRWRKRWSLGFVLSSGKVVVHGLGWSQSHGRALAILSSLLDHSAHSSRWQTPIYMYKSSSISQDAMFSVPTCVLWTWVFSAGNK